jgi:hypothetical protein
VVDEAKKVAEDAAKVAGKAAKGAMTAAGQKSAAVVSRVTKRQWFAQTYMRVRLLVFGAVTVL